MFVFTWILLTLGIKKYVHIIHEQIKNHVVIWEWEFPDGLVDRVCTGTG